MPFFITTLASSLGSSKATELFGTMNFSNPTWDLFIILFFVVASLLYGLSLGRERIMANMVAIYMALAVMQAVPPALNVRNYIAIRIFVFLGMFAILFFVLSRSILRKSMNAATERKGSMFQSLFFAMLLVGLLISTALSMLPEKNWAQFSVFIQHVFILQPARFVWVALPIVSMIIFRPGSRRYSYS